MWINVTSFGVELMTFWGLLFDRKSVIFVHSKSIPAWWHLNQDISSKVYILCLATSLHWQQATIPRWTLKSEKRLDGQSPKLTYNNYLNRDIKMKWRKTFRLREKEKKKFCYRKNQIKFFFFFGQESTSLIWLFSVLILNF